ncbi:MAG TPA: hypothetical protein VFE24_11945 [Pirellulales bacterium]|jgi:hypothetical protein|nr:hypothetical protein [Pirellulales bacterium]
MNVSFACPNCEAQNRAEIGPDDRDFGCAACGQRISIPAGALEDGRLSRCLVCPSTDLFVRKDFPQRLGVALVATGIIGSSIAWYQSSPIWTFAILGASALLDVALYAIVGNALMCYRCRAQYRDLAGLDEHGAFDLETHEKHRQQLARLAERRAAVER